MEKHRHKPALGIGQSNKALCAQLRQRHAEASLEKQSLAWREKKILMTGNASSVSRKKKKKGS